MRTIATNVACGVVCVLGTQKRFPVLVYGLEACPLHKDQYKSINSTFRKIFNTRSQDIVDVCLEMFNFLQAVQTIAIRKRKFLNKFSVINNVLCQVFVVSSDV